MKAMLPAAILLLPVIASFALVTFYGPVQASLNPGNAIMTASDHVFQTDTFSLDGSIGSLAGDDTDPQIVTGTWSLEVRSGNVTSFAADLAIVNASGAGYHTVQLANLTLARVTMEPNGTAIVSGALDVAANGTAQLAGVNATISVAKLKAVRIAIGDNDFLLGRTVYGMANPGEETTVAGDLLPDGSGLASNITDKFRLPQLPNPFR